MLKWLVRKIFRNAGWYEDLSLVRSGHIPLALLEPFLSIYRPKTVICLADNKDGRFDAERRLCERKGILWYGFDWGSTGPPTPVADVRVAANLYFHGTKPVWIHCMGGKDRTGGLCMLIARDNGWKWKDIRDRFWNAHRTPNPGWCAYVMSLEHWVWDGGEETGE